MASFNDVRKNLLNNMADRNRIGGDEAGAGVWGAMADGKMTAANCDELAEEMKHATGLTLQRKRANEATAGEKRSVGLIHEADRIAYEKKVSSEAAKMNLARWSELQFVFNGECKALLAAAKNEVATYPDGPAARVEMITRT